MKIFVVQSKLQIFLHKSSQSETIYVKGSDVGQVGVGWLGLLQSKINKVLD